VTAVSRGTMRRRRPAAPGLGGSEGAHDVVDMRVEGIGRDPAGETYFLILRERDGERRLVLQIGPFEAAMIGMALGGGPVPRPFTHDLLVQAVTRLGGRVERVLIHDVRNETFIGVLELGTDRGLIELDCRPSDGVAVALRTEAAILAAEEVLDKAGLVPGQSEWPEGPEKPEGPSS